MAPKSERPATRQATGSSSKGLSPYPKPSSRPSRRNVGGEGDGDESPSSGGNRSTRQQYSACGACRMRRVKCDLKEMAVVVAPGMRPVCTNCAERQINCVDEYSAASGKPGKPKLLRRGRRIQGAEALFGKAIDSPGETPSIIPDLALEFFTSPFFLSLQVQRPILEPSEFTQRYAAHLDGDTNALGPAGLILAKVLVVWSASFGHNEFGQLIDDGRASPLADDANDLAQRRLEWGAVVQEMIEELLRMIDVHGVLRKPSWDGVRALLLLLPLTVDSPHPQIERLAMMEATLCQIYTLCSLSPPTPHGHDGMNDVLVRARIFWAAYVTEGVTSALRGGRLILDNEDLMAFQHTLPRSSSSHNSSRPPSPFSFARRYAGIVLDISSACRLVHSALTGPRARQRPGAIDEQTLNHAWESLDAVWGRLEDAHSHGTFGMVDTHDADRFISSWQIYIFEAFNVIREALKQRVLSIEGNPSHSAAETQAAHEQVRHLHDRAIVKCYHTLPAVMAIIRDHDPHGPNRHFFSYDASIVRDGCFFAAILLATSDSHFGTTEDLRRDIDACINALRAMRWAFSRSEERERSIEHEWERRRQRLDIRSPTSASFPSGAFTLPLSTMPPGSAPPPLSVPVFRDTPPSTGGGTWSAMPMLPPHAASADPFAFNSYPGNTSAAYQPLVHTVTPPGSAGSRPSTSGGGHEASHRLLPYPSGPGGGGHALDSPFYTGSPAEPAHGGGHHMGSMMVPRGPPHGIELGMMSAGLGHGGGRHPYGEVEPSSATSAYPPWQGMHLPGPHH